MKIAYYLNEGRKKNLYCRISDGAERVTFSMEYSVDAEKWNEKKGEVDFEDTHYFTLIQFKEYLTKKYYELKSEGKDDVLARLKNEALSFTQDAGINGVTEKMFDYFNSEQNFPKYKDFIQAFEKFSKLKENDYKVETIDNIIRFHTKDKIYEMDTDEGLTARLKDFIERRAYDEICTETDRSIWSEIYIDADIEKHVFLPKMFNEWKIYWNTLYKNIRESVGKTDHLNEMKQTSWREFQIFMECYDGHGDAIKLAFEINQDELYPIAVIATMKIFDADTCYTEYCEHEFFGGGKWESVSLDDEDNSPMFFIRPCEF
ncbi:MAG: hypothetical protein LBR10_02430 [Prevotellaceae bacterium]|jgi:hypothetical protein|nr:hypothetical protein [Prevotellaceae bacterium]